MAQSTQALKNSSSSVIIIPKRRNVLGYYLLAIVAYAIFFSIWQVELVPLYVHVAAIVVGATCFIPLARWYGSGAQGLPMFELVCLSYAIQFSTPIYHQPNYLVLLDSPVYFSWDVVFETLLCVEFGVVALFVGYYLLRRSSWVQSRTRLDLPMSTKRLPYYLAMAITLSGVGFAIQSTGALASISSVSSLVTLAINQIYIVIVLLSYVTFGHTQRSSRYSLLLLATTVLAVAGGLTTGMLENAFIPIALVFVVRWHIQRRIPWRWIALGFVAFIILNGAKSAYRDIAWSRDDLTLTDRLSLWADTSQQVVQELPTDDPAKGISDLTRASMFRFDLIHKFAQVYSMIPRYVPFYSGETYEYMLIGWIPRVIWPDKPAASDSNQQLDIELGFKYSSQEGRSTIGIGQLPEAYANYGIVGIIVVMLVQGMIFAGLDQVLNGPCSEGGRAIYLSLMVFLLNGIGSSTSIWFGGLIQYTVAYAILLRPFATGWRARSNTTGLESVPTAKPSTTLMGIER